MTTNIDKVKQLTAVVINNGSKTCRAGFAGYDRPKYIFDSSVGSLKHPRIVFGTDGDTRFTGQEAEDKKDILNFNYPINFGIICNWTDMEKVWHHTFYNVLRINPAEHPVIITEVPLNPVANKDRMCYLMFEVFKVLSLYSSNQAVLSLYATGRTTGVVLDIGDSISHSVPIYEGYSLPHAINRLYVGGRDLNTYLKKILTERGYSFATSIEEEVFKEIKEKLCFVALEYETDMKKNIQDSSLAKTYKLKDGNNIILLNERFRCPEVLFKPRLIRKEEKFGIHEILYKTINKCDTDIKPDLYRNIVLSGGSSLLKGLKDRIYLEMKCRSPADWSVEVILGGKHSAWVGGSILASLSTFKEIWISKEEYDDHGPTVIHRKCFN